MSKKEKKKLKKAKKRAARPEIYDPEKTESFEGSLILGYFLRLLTVAFAAFSVVFMLSNSFGISKEVNGFATFMFCLGTTLAVSLVFYGKWKLTLVGFGVIFAYIAVVNIAYGNPLTFFITGIDDLFDAIFSVIDERGFYVYDFVRIPSFGYADNLLKGGTYTLAFVVSLFFTLFSLRKARLTPFVILGSAVCAVCFIYNISESNWGISLLITALAAMVALARYDKVFIKNKKSKKSRAYSGYVSVMAGILCLAIVLVPALAVKKSFREIGFIQRPLDNIRTKVTAILLGIDPENNKMNTLEDEVSTDFEEIKTSGDVLFKVKAYSNRPIYLRSWIGDSYDTTNDSWSVLSPESYKELTDLMSNGGGRAFSGDALTYHLYNLLYHYNLDEKNFPKDKGYTSVDHAFTATMVDIQYVGNTGSLYVLPTVYAEPIGLYTYGSSEEEYNDAFNVYSDGMYNSGMVFHINRSYRAPAIIPNYKNRNYETVSENDAKYFILLAEFIDKEVPSYQYSISEEYVEELDCVKKFKRLLDENGLYDMGIGPLKDYLMLPSYEQREWYNVYVRGVNAYTQFVKDNYLKVPESQAVFKIRGELLEEFENAKTSHAKIMTVIDYLCENYKYSLNPKHDPEFEGSVLDEFLLSKNEGYCVQFASAATVLLRSLGIPARYVQGYTAYDFGSEVMHDEDGDRYYEAKVTDKNAHAWVEVYIEGLGWRAYETTPEAYDSIYYQSPGTSSPSSPKPPEKPNQPESKPEDPVIPPPVVEPGEEITDEIVEENTFDTKKFTRFMTVLAIVVIATGAVWVLVRRADNIRDTRSSAFERAQHSSFIDGYDRRMLAAGMTDMFYSTLAIGKDVPKKGEAPSEFAVRVEKLWKKALEGKGRKKKRAALMSALPYTVREMTDIISKLEFSGSISDEELGRLAEYICELQKYEYQSKNIFGKVWYRYIVCKL
ncbi:MAG: transglutaminase domain-containing protein [Clostridia bacterium]|nr:transglutaminase domain-containing protein [Clostridia bacterium]